MAISGSVDVVLTIEVTGSDVEHFVSVFRKIAGCRNKTGYVKAAEFTDAELVMVEDFVGSLADPEQPDIQE